MPSVGATVHAGLGKWEQTLSLMEPAVQERDDRASEFSMDSVFDPVRERLRFQRLLRSVGLASSDGVVKKHPS